MIVKNLGIPLLPFLFEFIVRCIVFWECPKDRLSDYVDTNTLLVTVSIWMIFILTMSPKRPQIPTDSSARDALEAARTSLLTFIIFGLMTVGLMSAFKALVAQDPNLADEAVGRIIEVFTYLSVAYFLLCISYVALKAAEIRELGA